MRQQYQTPVLKIKTLESEDVLLISNLGNNFGSIMESWDDFFNGGND